MCVCLCLCFIKAKSCEIRKPNQNKWSAIISGAREERKWARRLQQNQNLLQTDNEPAHSTPPSHFSPTGLDTEGRRGCWTWKWDPNAPWAVTSGSSYWVSGNEHLNILCANLCPISSHRTTSATPISVHCVIWRPLVVGQAEPESIDKTTNKQNSRFAKIEKGRGASQSVSQSKLNSNACSQTGWGRPSICSSSKYETNSMQWRVSEWANDEIILSLDCCDYIGGYSLIVLLRRRAPSWLTLYLPTCCIFITKRHFRELLTTRQTLDLIMYN